MNEKKRRKKKKLSVSGEEAVSPKSKSNGRDGRLCHFSAPRRFTRSFLPACLLQSEIMDGTMYAIQSMEQ